MSSAHPIYVWDFTASAEKVKKDDIIKWCNEKCKKWCFQLERGAQTDYLHYQGRISLHDKTRNMTKVLAPTSWSPTSKTNADNEFYVTKEETRVEGPWRNEDPNDVIYIPRQIREIETLRPWQQTIVDSASDWDTRSINYIYCPEGNKGKSTLCGYVRAYRIGRVLPVVNDCKDLLRMVCDMPTSKMYLFDMPRSMNKDRLYGFYSAVEMIKDGYAYDDRYNFKEKVFDCPIIYIFSNTLPTTTLLSADRWKVYMIANNELIRRPEGL